MRDVRTLGCILLVAALAGCSQREKQATMQTTMKIEIETLGGEAGKVDATARWVDQGDETWAQGDPGFTATHDTPDLSARGWCAVTDDELRLRVEITDPTHIGAPNTTELWAGDGIEVCVDARGDAVGLLPKDTAGVMGPDDAKFILAMTPKGVIGRCFAADRGENKGDLPGEWVSAKRDDAAKTTAYELRVPWTRFETRPGLYPAFGLAIQFNDLDPGSRQRTIMNWGGGTFGNIKTGLFNRVAIQAPTKPVSASVVDNDTLWTPRDRGLVVLAMAGKGTYRVEASVGDAKAEAPLEVGEDLVRVGVRLEPGETDETAVPFSVLLRDAAGTELQKRTGSLSIVDAVYRSIHDIVDQRLAGATHPLYRRHLLSIKALVETEWGRLTLYKEYGYRGNARETYQYFKRIHRGLAAGRGTWEHIAKGEADMYMSYVSRQDRTVQFYVLSLPKNWDPEKEYPLFVELHGAGNENFMSDMASRLGVEEGALDLKGYTDRRSYIQKQGLGYWIMPSGRGNLGYRGPGEKDVWEAYDDVHELFEIDPDRRYLFGFSMGGGGTWSLGTRTPDRWAAIMIMAGGMWRESEKTGLGRNISYLPVYVWCGEEDTLCARYFPAFKKEIERWGNTPVLKTVPGLGHNYHPDIQVECAQWLPKHTRTRPAKFSFVADTDEHKGVWGITMTRDKAVSALPHFTCEIDGANVNLTSEGTPGMQVNLGEGGLGLTGEVTLTWNGERAYAGRAKVVRVGEFREGRRRRR